MRILLNLKMKIFNLIFGKNQNETIEIQEIDRFVEKLGNPQSLTDRSYYQYLCQRKKYEKNLIFKILYFCLNIVSFFGICILLINPFFSIGKPSSKSRKNKNRNADAICLFNETIRDRIPNSIYRDYTNISFVPNPSIVLTRTEKKLILQIWKIHICSCNFVLKNFLKIGMYRQCIESTNGVRAIIVTGEDSYTSSILTEYCRMMHIEHINVMHGEMLYQLNRMYFAFDKCYVWDEFYKKLAIDKLLALPEQFFVEVAPCLTFNKNYTIKTTYKYYLQDHNLDQLKHVKKILDIIGVDYKVRAHPIFSNKDDVYKVFDRDKIEENDIPIEASIMETRFIISWNSTVLFQAYVNNRIPVIDDVTNRERYQYSVDAQYIMIDKSLRLSDTLIQK